jgi:5-oxoprolinase (ATP-hydrolysing) subunit A
VPDESPSIDLNADVGEAGDDAGIAVERALLGLVTSAHIACGGHAGDAGSMRATALAALENGVRIGAHPSYPDREGFGRRPMDITPRDLSSALVWQIAALIDVAASIDATVQSVKPHGALYGEIARGTAAFEALLTVILELCGPEVSLVLPSGTPAVAMANDAGVRVLREGFADRAYTATGELASRKEPGAVYGEPPQAATQALGLVLRGTVTLRDGTVLSLPVDTLCVHGDSPNAPSLARAVGEALAEAGIAVAAPSVGRR